MPSPRRDGVSVNTLAGLITTGGLVALVIRLEVERRRGLRYRARHAGYLRHVRAGCPTCARLFWLDHGWEPIDAPGAIYCRPECCPTNHPTT